MNEFDLIQTYLAGLAGPEGLGLLDDVALWTPPGGSDAIISTDTLAEGVHFPMGKLDSQVAQKLLRTNISDIVSKGADPVGYLLSLTLSQHVNEGEIKDFCAGLAADQKKYGLKLWGGDTTRSPGLNVISITILGTAPTGRVVKRSSAQPGDIVCVTGTIGDACLGLKVVLNQCDEELSESASEEFLSAYHIPNPPFKVRHGIRECASAALDVSDGLIADAAHLANATGVSIVINLAKIPLSKAALQWADNQPDPTAARLHLATGGDDYQVVMTVKPDNFKKLASIARKCRVRLTKIGQVDSGAGVQVLDDHSQPVQVEKPGYSHF